MRRALERHNADDAQVVPIIVEPCDWNAIPELHRLRALPKDGKPISLWENANTAYLDIVQEIRRIINASKTDVSVFPNNAPAARKQSVPRYRAKRDFDEIDRRGYHSAAFTTIKDYFRRAIDEVNAVEGVRGHFTERGANSFGSIVINKSLQRGTAHITVYCGNGGYALGDIYFSFSENAAEDTANGGLNVSSDEYDQFLVTTMMLGENKPDRLNPEQAAEYLWSIFIQQAGITYV